MNLLLTIGLIVSQAPNDGAELIHNCRIERAQVLVKTGDQQAATKSYLECLNRG